MTQLQSLRGMVDLLPQALQRWQAVEAVAREHFAVPVLVRSAAVVGNHRSGRGIGEGTDVVGKEMASFPIAVIGPALRPGTYWWCVRRYSGLLNQGAQTLVRRPDVSLRTAQAGRQRQFHQIGVVAGRRVPAVMWR